MYDVVVIGDDLSSLIAATLISRRGGKVVLLQEGDSQYAYSESGYCFHIDPLPLTGFAPGETCHRLFSELDINLAEHTGPGLLNPGLQIILPEHRIDSYYDREALLAELKREFPDNAGDISAFYASISAISNLVWQWIRENPHLYPQDHKSLTSLIKKIPAIAREKFLFSKTFTAIRNNPSLTRTIEAEMALFSYSYAASRNNLAALTAYSLSLPLKGLYYHASGRGFLMQSLKSRFMDTGGVLINNCSVSRLSAKKEINIDINTDNKLSSVSGRYLIASTKWEKLGSLLLNERKFRRLKGRLKSAETLFYPFTLHMGVDEKGIPEKMTTYVVIINDKNAPVMDDNIVIVELSPSGETDRAPAGKRALSATVFLKESTLTLSDEELKETAAVIFQTLETFLPFLKENLDLLNIDMSIELSRKYQKLVNQKYSFKPSAFFGLSGISPKTTMRNFFMTGGMLLAGLGFEGEIISGMNAANAIIERGE